MYNLSNKNIKQKIVINRNSWGLMLRFYRKYNKIENNQKQKDQEKVPNLCKESKQFSLQEHKLKNKDLFKK